MILRNRARALVLAALLAMGAIGSAQGEPAASGTSPAGAAGELRIVHAPWTSSLASAHVVAEAIRTHLGVRVVLTEATAEEAWAALAAGEQDAFLSAWLPSTHEVYLDRHRDALVDLGPNLEGTRTGLMVPDIAGSRQTGARGRRGVAATDLTSIEDLAGRADAFGRRIVGIEADAGVMLRTRRALDAYGLDDWDLVVTGGEAAMLRHLAEAIRADRPIVVTGWVPLWAHARWSLRFLDDPRGVFGGTERIHTFVRPGLRDDMPEVTAALDGFAWTPDAMQQVMIWMQGPGTLPRDAAGRWLGANEDRAAAWFE